LIGLDIQG